MGIYSKQDGVHCNTTNDYQYKQLYGTPCTGGQTIDLPNDGTPVSLSPVVGANVQKQPLKAIVLLETDGTEAGPVAARFRMCGADPDAGTGFPLANFGQLSVCGQFNIANFKIAATEEGKAHLIRVMYFE